MVTDPRLREISGMVSPKRGVIYAINDKAPSLIYRLDASCRVVSTLTLGVRVRDTEDLAMGPDRSLWVADIGGNVVPRRAVALFRRLPHGGVKRFNLRYPDGSHDAEALMISRLGQIVIVTKRANGQSRVYSAQLPLGANSVLTLRAKLDMRALRPKRRGSLCITGAAVSLGGERFVLRTYTTAFEWDAPGGDIVRALRLGKPRAIPLARTRQGEAVTYSVDGNELLTGTEMLPAPVHSVAIVRR